MGSPMDPAFPIGNSPEGIDVAFEEFMQRHGRSYVRDSQVPWGFIK